MNPNIVPILSGSCQKAEFLISVGKYEDRVAKGDAELYVRGVLGKRWPYGPEARGSGSLLVLQALYEVWEGYLNVSYVSATRKLEINATFRRDAGYWQISLIGDIK